MGTQAHTPVEDLEREIDEILDTHAHEALRRRRLALTEENVRRLFGLSLWDLFRALADQFGYVIEDESTQDAKAP